MASFVHFEQIFKINKLIAVQLDYMRNKDRDCLAVHDLPSLESDGTTDHSNCQVWCNNNVICAGFIVRSNTCYFKNEDCEYESEEARSTDFFLKLGI